MILSDGLYPLVANVQGLTASCTAKVEWFLYDGSGNCGTDPRWKLGEQEVNGGDSLDPNRDHVVGNAGGTDGFHLVVPCNGAVTIGADYHVCAVLSATDGSCVDAVTTDNVVFSDRMFHIDDLPSGVGCSCEPPTASEDCPVGTSCQCQDPSGWCPEEEPYAGYGCEM